MQATDMPNGLSGVGYSLADVDDLVEGSLPQRRLLDNAPIDIDREMLTTLYEGALSYW
jgi:alcohol dehydrogenase class IV